METLDPDRFEPGSKEFEDSPGISAIENGRQKALEAAKEQSNLGVVAPFETLDEMAEAIFDISLAREYRWYRRPPVDVIESGDAVDSQLPDEAQGAYQDDHILERRERMPSPVEAGPANYPLARRRTSIDTSARPTRT
jgi:hypothetical protein